MGKTVEDLEIYCRGVVDGQPWLHDPRCLPLPWRVVTVPTKLKIGVIWHDGVVRPTPPVARALRETVEKLRMKGHEVFEWEPKGHVEGVQLLVSRWTGRG